MPGITSIAKIVRLTGPRPATPDAGLKLTMMPGAYELVIFAVALLLALLESVVALATLAVLEIVPATIAVTVMVTVAVVPLGSVPMLQVTTFPAAPHVPCVEEAETKVTPAGSVSVKVTAVAVAAPLLVIPAM